MNNCTAIDTILFTGVAAQTFTTGSKTFGAVQFNKAGGSVTVNGPLNAVTLASLVGAYDVSLNNSGTITNAVTFSNTGVLAIGLGFTFTGGVIATAPSVKSTSGTISTAGGTAIDFTGVGLVLLTGNTTFSTGTGALTLGGVATGVNASLIIQNTGGPGATIASANLGNGVLNLAGVTGGAITVTGVLNTNGGIVTAGNAYNIFLNGGGTVAGATTFSNTGTLFLGGGFVFTGGVTATAPSAVNIAGNVSAAGLGVINFNNTVTITVNAIIGGATETGQITLANVTINDGLTLTVGAWSVNADPGQRDYRWTCWSSHLESRVQHDRRRNRHGSDWSDRHRYRDNNRRYARSRIHVHHGRGLHDCRRHSHNGGDLECCWKSGRGDHCGGHIQPWRRGERRGQPDDWHCPYQLEVCF